MPLHTHHKLFARVIGGLHNAVVGNRHAAQRLAQLFDALMVQGVDADLQQALAEGVQWGVADDVDLMHHLVLLLGLGALVLDVHAALVLGVDILIHGAAGDHIQHLESAADAEHRLIHRDGLLHQRDFQRVALRRQSAAAVQQLLPIQSRVDVRSAAEQHAVHPLQQLIQVRNLEGALQAAQLDRDTPTGADTVDKVRKDIAELAVLVPTVSGLWRNRDNRLSHCFIPPLMIGFLFVMLPGLPQ